MDIFGALAIAAIATATAIVSQLPAVRKAVQTAVNTVVTPVVDWWNENVAAPSAPSGDGDDGDDSPAPARQSGEEISAVVQPEPTYDPDAGEFFEGDTPEMLAAEVADQRADVSSATHIYLPDSKELEGLDLELLADYSAEVAASLMLMVVHEPGILATALMMAPTVARAIDGLLAKSYLVEEGSDGLLTWLEYEFGPALKQRLGERLDARRQEAEAFEVKYRRGAGYGKAGYDLRMAADGIDDVSQDKPGEDGEQKYPLPYTCPEHWSKEECENALGLYNIFINEKGEYIQKPGEIAAFDILPIGGLDVEQGIATITSFGRMGTNWADPEQYKTTCKVHPGIDFMAPAGTDINTVADGIVVLMVTYDPELNQYTAISTRGEEYIRDEPSRIGYGQPSAPPMVVIRHGDYLTVYGHVDSGSGLQVGTVVEKGQKIGTLTPYAPSPEHLHFEVMQIPEEYISGLRDIPDSDMSNLARGFYIGDINPPEKWDYARWENPWRFFNRDLQEVMRSSLEGEGPWEKFSHSDIDYMPYIERYDDETCDYSIRQRRHFEAEGWDYSSRIGSIECQFNEDGIPILPEDDE